LKARSDGTLQMRSGGRMADPFDQLVGERMDEHAARLVGPDAARAEEEEGVVVEPADGRAVAALHVVGEDLELRLGVDDRVAREEEILVDLSGVALLRLRAYEHLAVEDGARAPVEHSLVELAARALGRAMIDRGVVVDVLPAVCQVEAVERAGRARRVEERLDVDAGEARADRHGMR